jgi:catechol 2,3-dioxygenase-like lactoylglutathione lyase family enzyme
MHRSRVGSIVIDCDDFDAGVAFWSAALGARPGLGERDERYADVGVTLGPLRVLIQRVPEPKTAKTRLHLDIETDDVDAEVGRLEALGARRQRGLGDGTWIMEDVCGNEFCVVHPETPGFPDRAVVWEG